MMLLITIVLAVAAALLAFYLYFIRDPVRTIPPDEDAIVSPADGRVIEVLNWDKKQSTHHKGLGSVSVLCDDVASRCRIIAIFMSPLDVHVNRIPYDGSVLSVRHSPGAYNPASSLALQNEKNEVLLSSTVGKMKVVQIAGLVARRIECWLRPNQKVIKGERYGRIILGSQVLLIMPARLQVFVKKGDKVKAGETVVARP